MKALLLAVIAVFASILLSPTIAHGLSTVVVSQLQTGDSQAATNEAVELYNNSTFDQDISNWCIRYTPATSQTLQSSPKYCFTPIDAQTKIFLTAQSYAAIVTSGYSMPSGLSPDGRFSGSGMAAAGGHVRLLDSLGGAIDTVGWGTGIFGEGYVAISNPAPLAPTSLQALFRKVSSASVLQDTDNNRADFEIKAPTMRTGGIYEVRIPVDICGNLTDLQESMPEGYSYDEAGNCELLAADMCNNIAAIQLSPPDTLLRDSDGGCYTDRCVNLDGLQRDVPSGFILQSGTCHELEHRELWLNEVLPNVTGSDGGHEYIELYNPNDDSVSLAGYTLQIGKNFETGYVLGSDVSAVSIPAHGYVTFYDDDLGFSLLNTVSSIRVLTPAGTVVSETSYDSPREDQSWALIDSVWQYTNILTPQAANFPMSMTITETESTTSSVQPCPVGKYRHPITNRCRNIESDSALLVACDADEYRNPETNRCRKTAILAATLTSCNVGYERNPETNRCKKIGDVLSALTPCQSGYERNPETNRCRKANALAAVAEAPAAASPDAAGSSLKTALIVTVGACAIGYGLYEWRSEVFRGIRRLALLVSGK